VKAAYYRGDKTFAVEEVDAAEVAADEVKIEVAYCGICGTDMHVYHGAMDARVTTNRVIGHEMSGQIVEVGSDVSTVSVGDRVVVRPLVHCGECAACTAGHQHVCNKLLFLGLDTHGAFQQYWSVPAHTVHKIPPQLDLSHAALIEPVAVACHDVRLSRLVPGEDVLVIGGGPIGLLIAMVAKAAGGNVTVSEISEYRRQIATSLGLATLDPTQQDVGASIYASTDDKGADVIFEVSGSQAGVDTMTEAASVKARIVMVAIHTQKANVDLFKFFWREIELLGARVYEPEDYEKAISLVDSGAIDANTMITNIASIDNIGEAFHALDTDSQSMKTLIRCSSNV